MVLHITVNVCSLLGEPHVKTHKETHGQVLLTTKEVWWPWTTKQESGETLALFYGQLHKNVSKIDQHIGNCEICRIFLSSLSLQNKATKNLRNSYHVKDIRTLEEVVIRLRTTNVVDNSPTLARETKWIENGKERKMGRTPRLNGSSNHKGKYVII